MAQDAAQRGGSNELQAISDQGLHVNDRGRLVDHNDEPIHASRPNGKQRLRFTEEDDKDLLEWVTRAELEGLKSTGFGLFVDLERVNPRHPTTSWYARWARAELNEAVRPLIYDADLPERDFEQPAASHPGTGGGGEGDRQENDHPGQVANRNIGQIRTQHTPTSHPQELPSSCTKLYSRSEGVRLSTDLPPLRTAPDKSQAPPPHFHRLEDHTQSGRTTLAKNRGDSEVTLRQHLELDSREDLRSWLLQEWVLHAYDEYATAVFDPLQAQTLSHVDGDDPGDEQTQGTNQDLDGRYSERTYLINNAVGAVLENNARYLSSDPNLDGWTRDDYDVRFIARIAKNGTQPGRWWEHTDTSDPKEVEKVCAVAHRLLVWLRYMHRFSRRYNDVSPWQKTLGFFWVPTLSQARSLYVKTLSQRPPAKPQVPSTEISRSSSTNDDMNASSVSAHKADSVLFEKVGQDGKTSGGHSHRTTRQVVTTGHAVNSPPESYEAGHAPPPVDELLRRTSSLSLVSLDSFYSTRSDFSSGETTPVQDTTHIDPPMEKKFDFPALPAYEVKGSSSRPGQIRAAQWLTTETRQRFLNQQDRLLALWGVSKEHASSCVLVPNRWSAVDPSEIIDNLHTENYPLESEFRLIIALDDYNTRWVRAATWFNDWSTPRRGADLDLFLGSGPYVPMEGSHLCHHGQCVVPSHAVYEDAITNGTRRGCLFTAQTLRNANREIPWSCDQHTPPCLLQLSALTQQEVFLIQVSMLRRAKGLPVITPLSRPASHRYDTFEHDLPLAFKCAPTIDSTRLVRPLTPDENITAQSLTFHCRFCGTLKVYKKVTSYWGHIRDFHGLVDNTRRLEEIKETAKLWREHQDLVRKQGGAYSSDHPTSMKLQQINAPGFSWEVVKSWKLRYSRER